MQKNPTSLISLQNLMKRDPSSYTDELQQQWQHFLHHLDLMRLRQQQTLQPHLLREFTGLLTFLSHVASCFPTITASLPQHLLQLLSTQASTMPPSLRLSTTQALILLQNRGMVSRFTVLPVLFSLFGVADKALRQLVMRHVVADIVRVNRKRRDVKLNSALQTFIYGLMRDDSDGADTMAARKSLDVVIELWRRRVWTDDKTVDVIATACFSRHVKIMVAALRFFLGLPFYDEDEADDSDEEDGKKAETRKGLTLKREGMKGVTKKRKKREREIKRAVKKLNREDNKHIEHRDAAAIHLVHDPQSFAERLFSRLRSSSHSFPVRLLLMNVISRLIGAHRLLLLNFYPFVARYLQPHQRHVTSLLSYLAQSCHPLVPPDVLRPLVLALAGQFVTDRSSSEVMTVGINAIREICARQPLVMTRALLMDLAAHKKSKQKGVMMASRSLIALYRERLPELLKRRERGKAASMAMGRAAVAEEAEERDDDYGKVEYAVDVMGAELLKAEREKESTAAEGDERNAGGDAEDEWIEPQQDEAEEDEDDDEEQRVVTVGEVEAFLKELDAAGAAEEKASAAMDAEQQRLATARRSDERELEGEIDAEIDEAADEGDMEDEMNAAGHEDAVGEEESEPDEGEEEEQGKEGEEEVEINEGLDDQPQSPANKKQKVAAATASPAALIAAASSSSMSGPALPYAATRIFTPKDFALLRQLRLNAALAASASSSSSRAEAVRAKKETAAVSTADTVADVVDADALKGYRPRKRLSKEERLASVREGREGGRSGRGKVKGGGSTNAEKLKAKPFMLVKHSEDVRGKQRLSFSTVQRNAQQHIKNLRRQGKKAKRRIKAKRGY